MAQVLFTPNLERHVACPPRETPGRTVAEVLARVFDENPLLRGYVLDDQGAVRKHMLIFVDGLPLRDRRSLSDRVRDDARLFVMQALSGG